MKRSHTKYHHQLAQANALRLFSQLHDAVATAHGAAELCGVVPAGMPRRRAAALLSLCAAGAALDCYRRGQDLMRTATRSNGERTFEEMRGLLARAECHRDAAIGQARVARGEVPPPLSLAEQSQLR